MSDAKADPISNLRSMLSGTLSETVIKNIYEALRALGRNPTPPLIRSVSELFAQKSVQQNLLALWSHSKFDENFKAAKEDGRQCFFELMDFHLNNSLAKHDQDSKVEQERKSAALTKQRLITQIQNLAVSLSTKSIEDEGYSGDYYTLVTLLYYAQDFQYNDRFTGALAKIFYETSKIRNLLNLFFQLGLDSRILDTRSVYKLALDNTIASYPFPARIRREELESEKKALEEKERLAFQDVSQMSGSDLRKLNEEYSRVRERISEYKRYLDDKDYESKYGVPHQMLVERLIDLTSTFAIGRLSISRYYPDESGMQRLLTEALNAKKEEQEKKLAEERKRGEERRKEDLEQFIKTNTASFVSGTFAVPTEGRNLEILLAALASPAFVKAIIDHCKTLTLDDLVKIIRRINANGVDQLCRGATVDGITAKIFEIIDAKIKEVNDETLRFCIANAVNEVKDEEEEKANQVFDAKIEQFSRPTKLLEDAKIDESSENPLRTLNQKLKGLEANITFYSNALTYRNNTIDMLSTEIATMNSSSPVYFIACEIHRAKIQAYPAKIIAINDVAQIRDELARIYAVPGHEEFEGQRKLVADRYQTLYAAAAYDNIRLEFNRVIEQKHEDEFNGQEDAVTGWYTTRYTEYWQTNAASRSYAELQAEAARVNNLVLHGDGEEFVGQATLIRNAYKAKYEAYWGDQKTAQDTKEYKLVSEENARVTRRAEYDGQIDYLAARLKIRYEAEWTRAKEYKDLFTEKQKVATSGEEYKGQLTHIEKEQAERYFTDLNNEYWGVDRAAKDAHSIDESRNILSQFIDKYRKVLLDLGDNEEFPRQKERIIGRLGEVYRSCRLFYNAQSKSELTALQESLAKSSDEKKASIDLKATLADESKHVAETLQSRTDLLAEVKQSIQGYAQTTRTEGRRLSEAKVVDANVNVTTDRDIEVLQRNLQELRNLPFTDYVKHLKSLLTAHHRSFEDHTFVYNLAHVRYGLNLLALSGIAYRQISPEALADALSSSFSTMSENEKVSIIQLLNQMDGEYLNNLFAQDSQNRLQELVTYRDRVSRQPLFNRSNDLSTNVYQRVYGQAKAEEKVDHEAKGIQGGSTYSGLQSHEAKLEYLRTFLQHVFEQTDKQIEEEKNLRQTVSAERLQADAEGFSSLSSVPEEAKLSVRSAPSYLEPRVDPWVARAELNAGRIARSYFECDQLYTMMTDCADDLSLGELQKLQNLIQFQADPRRTLQEALGVDKMRVLNEHLLYGNIRRAQAEREWRERAAAEAAKWTGKQIAAATLLTIGAICAIAACVMFPFIPAAFAVIAAITALTAAVTTVVGSIFAAVAENESHGWEKFGKDNGIARGLLIGLGVLIAAAFLITFLPFLIPAIPTLIPSAVGPALSAPMAIAVGGGAAAAAVAPLASWGVSWGAGAISEWRSSDDVQHLPVSGHADVVQQQLQSSVRRFVPVEDSKVEENAQQSEQKRKEADSVWAHPIDHEEKVQERKKVVDQKNEIAVATAVATKVFVKFLEAERDGLSKTEATASDFALFGLSEKAKLGKRLAAVNSLISAIRNTESNREAVKLDVIIQHLNKEGVMDPLSGGTFTSGEFSTLLTESGVLTRAARDQHLGFTAANSFDILYRDNVEAEYPPPTLGT